MFYHETASKTSGDKRKGVKKRVREETLLPLLIDQGNTSERVKCTVTSFVNVSFNADESCQMTEATVVYPLNSPGSANRGASCLHSFARRSQPGLGVLSLEATAIPPPAPDSPRLAHTANRVPRPMLLPGHTLLLFTTAPNPGLILICTENPS